MIRLPDIWFISRPGLIANPASCADQRCLIVILPVFLFTSTWRSWPRTSRCACRSRCPSRSRRCRSRGSRPARAACTSSAATAAALSTPRSEATRRSPRARPSRMFWRRNVNGSMFAASASMSIICSDAKFVCGPDGARSAPFWNVPIARVCVFAIRRRPVLATLYIGARFSSFVPAAPSARERLAESAAAPHSSPAPAWANATASNAMMLPLRVDAAPDVEHDAPGRTCSSPARPSASAAAAPACPRHATGSPPSR